MGGFDGNVLRRCSALRFMESLLSLRACRSRFRERRHPCRRKVPRATRRQGCRRSQLHGKHSVVSTVTGGGACTKWGDPIGLDDLRQCDFRRNLLKPQTNKSTTNSLPLSPQLVTVGKSEVGYCVRGFGTQFSSAPCVERPDLLPGLSFLYHPNFAQPSRHETVRLMRERFPLAGLTRLPEDLPCHRRCRSCRRRSLRLVMQRQIPLHSRRVFLIEMTKVAPQLK